MERYETARFHSLIKDFSPRMVYRADGWGGMRKKVEYTTVFHKGTVYRMILVSKDGRGEGIVATIYNAKHKPLCTTLAGTKHQDFIDFKIKSTGIYHITFTFEHSKSFCGFGILGFRKD